MTGGATGSATVKCLVWDLDDTLWDGIVLVTLRFAGYTPSGEQGDPMVLTADPAAPPARPAHVRILTGRE